MKIKGEKGAMEYFGKKCKKKSETKNIGSLSQNQIQAFRKEIYDYFKKNSRDLPWRNTQNPYHILVSEIMLQQTQVDRVIKKFKEFISEFPDFSSLHQASLSKVYNIWKGLGYNRRALSMKKIGEKVMVEFGGHLPTTEKELSTFPGIGAATASSICAFAYNMPTVFIETNIRTVFINWFFRNDLLVDDREIFEFVRKTLDKKNPFKWYSALMDYGAMLKKNYPELTQRSIHYKRQSLFQGSRRQIRGKLLKILLNSPKSSITNLKKKTGKTAEKQLLGILSELVQEGMIKLEKGRYFIP
jgi:A/G-specific adenine glycosylase